MVVGLNQTPETPWHIIQDHKIWNIVPWNYTKQKQHTNKKHTPLLFGKHLKFIKQQVVKKCRLIAPVPHDRVVSSWASFTILGVFQCYPHTINEGTHPEKNMKRVFEETQLKWTCVISTSFLTISFFFDNLDTSKASTSWSQKTGFPNHPTNYDPMRPMGFTKLTGRITRGNIAHKKKQKRQTNWNFTSFWYDYVFYLFFFDCFFIFFCSGFGSLVCFFFCLLWFCFFVFLFPHLPGEGCYILSEL